MNVQDIVTDVSDALSLGNGCGLDDKEGKRIVRGIKRILDRFSIDARKLPVVCELSYDIETCDTRLSVGREGRFKLWGDPVAIHYAAWKHGTNCCYGLCEDFIKITTDIQDFSRFSDCRDFEYCRPTELFYQSGEIAFNSRPFVGDTLTLRAVMPFDDKLLECDRKDDCGEQFQFKICPDHALSNETREEVLRLAADDFDGNECWKGQYKAIPCDCADPIDVTVEAIKGQNFCPVEIGEMHLPPGYYDALVRILIYDYAPYANIPRDQFMRQDRNDAVNLLHRSNSRELPKEVDETNYWSHPCNRERLNIYGVTPRTC
jgi:hypothetical protein